MATPAEVKSFIKKIAPLAQNEYKKGKLILPSVCIAQACCESAYGTSPKMKNANAIFGIKVGKSKYKYGDAWKDQAYNTKTKECYDGKTYVEIYDFFRAYSSIEDSVTDYYDLLCNAKRYAAAVGQTDFVKTIEAIKAGGYATSPTYVNTITKIIRTYGLTEYDNITTPIESNTNITTKKAVEYALSIASDDSHGYDQNHRWGSDYDCSSLVIESWEKAGVPVKTNGATYTGNMKKVFFKTGFEEVIGKVDTIDGRGLEFGDVLLKEGSHVAMYIGAGLIVHASINENGKTKGGKVGDQTGKEICVRKYYNKPWNSVLRYTDEQLTTPELKSNDIIAVEVINGKWGSGDDRKNRLTNAGYNYSDIQKAVNTILIKPVTTHRVSVGDTLSDIASKYGTTVNSIIDKNKSQYPKIKPNFIVRGWVLYI